MDEPVPARTPAPNYIRPPYFGRNSHYIVQDLCTTLQQQMDALAGGSLSDLSGRELKAYRLREERICDLRKELEDFSLWVLAACCL